MRNLSTKSRIAALCLLTSVLSGCGAGDAVTNYMGFGKYSPDETQVQQNQTLTMPPDLQLRPPGEGEPAQATAAAQTYSPTQPVTTAPPQYGAVDPNTTYDATQPSSESTATQVATAQPAVPAASASDPVDPYTKWGISKTHPDGTAKTDAELRAELRKVALEQKKKENPNYGSIFNLPDVWGD